MIDDCTKLYNYDGKKHNKNTFKDLTFNSLKIGNKQNIFFCKHLFYDSTFLSILNNVLNIHFRV